MSLGPVDEGRQRLLGAACIALVGGAIAGVLALSGRTLGAGVRFDVEFASAGALKSGARIRLAGREAGEVRGLRRVDGKSDGRRVVAECFVARAFAPFVRRNSDLFISTPSILGEAFLEIGPPRNGAEPGPPVESGERLRGSDPPEIDRFIARVYAATTEILFLLREQKPAFDELLASGDALLGTLAGLPIERGQLGRIRDRIEAGVGDASALAEALRDGRVVPRAQAVAASLSSTIEQARPDLAQVADKAERAAERVRALPGLFGPSERDRLEEGLRELARAARTGERLADEVQAIADFVERGQGTIGGLTTDRELFDDLHETHRLLKWKGWRLFFKTPAGKPTAPED